MNFKNNFPIFPHPIKENENLFFEDGSFRNEVNKEDIFKILEFSKNTEGWNDELTRIADQHIGVNHPIDVASRELCIEFLEKYETSIKKVVLEVGCSGGNLISKIKELKKYNYIGSDAIKKHIERLSNLHNNNPFIVFDLLKNPFKKSICNALIMLNVLEHIKDDNSALIEASKILDKNGILIVEVPSGKFLYDDYDKQLLHFRRYNMKEIISKIENAGFRIEEKTYIGCLIFPIFILVKLFNKFFSKFFKSIDIVVKQANMSNNFFLKWLFNFEKKLRMIGLPFGIRCYICARKK